jgi:hypothetical protein
MPCGQTRVNSYPSRFEPRLSGCPDLEHLLRTKKDVMRSRWDYLKKIVKHLDFKSRSYSPEPSDAAPSVVGPTGAPGLDPLSAAVERWVCMPR